MTTFSDAFNAGPLRRRGTTAWRLCLIGCGISAGWGARAAVPGKAGASSAESQSAPPPEVIAAPPGVKAGLLEATAHLRAETSPAEKGGRVMGSFCGELTLEGRPAGWVLPAIGIELRSIRVGERAVALSYRGERQPMDGAFSIDGPLTPADGAATGAGLATSSPRVETWIVNPIRLTDFDLREIPEEGAVLEGEAFFHGMSRKLEASLPAKSGSDFTFGANRVEVVDVGKSDSAWTINLKYHGEEADDRWQAAGFPATGFGGFECWLTDKAAGERWAIAALSNRRKARVQWLAGGSAYLFASSSEGAPTSAGRKESGQFVATHNMLSAEFRQDGWRSQPCPKLILPDKHMIEFYRYQSVGQIRTPFRVTVRRPAGIPALTPEQPPATQYGSVPGDPVALRESRFFRELFDLGSSMDLSVLPERELRRWLEATGAVAAPDLKRVDPDVLLKNLRSAGHAYLPTLLMAVADAAQLQRPVQPRVGRAEEPGLPAFWGLVLEVARDLVEPGDKALVLAANSPAMDLSEVISAFGWEKEAVDAMREAALRQRVPVSWLDLLVRHPGPATTAALARQIEFGTPALPQLVQWIEDKILPDREGAAALWGSALKRGLDVDDLRAPLSLALKHGVPTVPLDVLRMVRALAQDATCPPEKLQRWHGVFSAAFAVHSDGPMDSSRFAAWIETNAQRLKFSDVSERYEVDGEGMPPPDDLEAWGGAWVDPLGAGLVQTSGRDLTIVCGGPRVQSWYDEPERFVPRVDREVTGDFTAEVTVLPTFTIPAWGIGHQGAGFLVEAGKERWLRWETAVQHYNERKWTLRDDMVACRVQDLQCRETPQCDRNKPLRLRLTRTKGMFHTAWQQGDGPWNIFPARHRLFWPDTVRLALVVNNTSDVAMKAKFSDYRFVAKSGPILNPQAYEGPHPGGTPTPTGTDLPPWGRLFDPMATAVVNAQPNELTMALVPRLPTPYSGTSMSCPRISHTVEGDFTGEVTLYWPGDGNPWCSSEAYIQAGGDYQFRFGCMRVGQDLPQVWVEELSGALHSWRRKLPAPRVLGLPLHVRFQRRGSLLFIAEKQTGDWFEHYPISLRRWPKKIDFGITGQNDRPTPLTVRFSDFKFSEP